MDTARRSQFLVLVLSLALAGLAVVLAVLLQSAWQAKEQALRRNVQSAVAATVRQLEAEEIAGQAVGVIAAEAAPGGSCPPRSGSAAPDSTGRLGVTCVVQDDSLQFLHVRRLVGADSAVMRVEGGTVAVVVRADRSRLVQRVVGDLVDLPPRPITERLDAARLDSLLRAQLRAVDILARPRFAVVAADSDRVVLAGTEPPAALHGGGGPRVRLFPLDMAPPRYDLVVEVPGSRALVLAQIWPLGAAAAAFLLVTVLAFVQALRTIARQRRFSGQVVAFINNMTHEFKTPLTTVSLACEALGRRLTDPDGARYLAMIGQETDRLGRQVQVILQMAQLEAGELPRGGEPVDLAQVAARSAEAFALQAERKGGTLRTLLPGRPTPVRSDAMHLASIVDNLLDNAVKYAHGAPQVMLTVAVNGDDVRLEVQDQGPGIPRAEQERIFEPYYRCPTGNRHDVKGFGLGLSFVKLLAELHGGRVELRSRPGQGTRVTVHLPLAAPEAEGKPA